MKDVEFTWLVPAHRFKFREGLIAAAAKAFKTTERAIENLDGTRLRVTAEQYGEFHALAEQTMSGSKRNTRLINPDSPQTTDLRPAPAASAPYITRSSPITGLVGPDKYEAYNLWSDGTVSIEPVKPGTLIFDTAFPSAKLVSSTASDGSTQFNVYGYLYPLDNFTGVQIIYKNTADELCFGAISKVLSLSNGAHRITITPLSKGEKH